jgi:hypothetical protein
MTASSRPAFPASTLTNNFTGSGNFGSLIDLFQRIGDRVSGIGYRDGKRFLS